MAFLYSDGFKSKGYILVSIFLEMLWSIFFSPNTTRLALKNNSTAFNTTKTKKITKKATIRRT